MKVQVPLKFNPSNHPLPELSWSDGLFKVAFSAMASRCSILIEAEPSAQQDVINMAIHACIECWRIEYKYSRYIADNYFSDLHANKDQWFKLDPETSRLCAFANQAWHLSEGLFDLSSGVLREIWQFHPKAIPPSQSEIENVLSRVGWQKIRFDDAKGIYLPEGMELDFGGIGKEYAVDRVLQILHKLSPKYAILVNFGGDIACNKVRNGGKSWLVGLDNSSDQLATHTRQALISLTKGAIATSGDTERFLIHKGKRYSHILNPKTGWPVDNAPSTITFAAPSCIQAGLMTTLSLLQGKNANKFAQRSGYCYWLND